MHQEDIDRVMNDPLAQELIGSRIPARLAYTGSDGFPRVVPVGFHWNGAEIVVCTPTNAAKVPALTANPKVALTIDNETLPPKVLLVRGTASVEMVDGVPDDYLAASHKRVDADHWQEFDESMRGLYQQMARISITPEWAKLLDFVTRIPKSVEELVRSRTSDDPAR